MTEPGGGTAAGPSARTPITTPLIVLASLVVIVAGLRAAAGFLVPLLSAVLLSLILAPGVVFLMRRGVSKGLAIALVTLLVVLAGAGVGLVVGDSLVGFTRELPARVRGLEQVEAQVYELLARLGVQVRTEDNPLNNMLDAGRVMGLFGDLLGAMRNLIASGFIILMLVVFGLLQIGRMGPMVEQALGPGSGVPAVLERYSGEVFQYLKVKSLMSLGTGIGVGLALAVLGIDYAVLWGLLAFLLNFIPNIGSLLAAVPPVALGLLDYGIGRGDRGRDRDHRNQHDVLERARAAPHGTQLRHVTVDGVRGPPVLGLRVGTRRDDPRHPAHRGAQARARDERPHEVAGRADGVAPRGPSRSRPLSPPAS